MTTAAIASTEGPRARRRLALGPWLWTPELDLALFGGSALLALLLVLLGRVTALDQEPFPEWAWLLFVLGIDVAHVYATLFRTYLDPVELRRHPLRYASVPLGVFAIGYALYAASSLWFWRFFAYAAVFHFIRQQVGWVAIYRAKSPFKGRLDRGIDQLAIYSATLYPLVHWHAHLETTKFAWFVEGDFLNWATLAKSVLPAFELVFWVALLAFGLRQLTLLALHRTLEVGKIAVVSSTAAIWYVGIVVTNNDFAFTVTNVIAHGVPYFALIWAYVKAHQKDVSAGFIAEIRQKGVFVFLAFLLALALAEELLWERLVFHDRPWLFGESSLELSPGILAVVVPLLMLPQATHYVLDGVLWRRKDTRALGAQRRALGMDHGAEYGQ